MNEDDSDSWRTRIEVQDCVVAFTASFDENDVVGMLAHFSPEGVWRRQDGDLRGHEALSTFMSKRSPDILVRHILTNFRVDVVSASEAICTSYVTVLRGMRNRRPPLALEGIDLMGRYEDRLRRINGRWLIADRSVRVDLRDIGSA